MQPFSAHVIEQIGWYVYALRDPRDQRVFYIGKGRGNRVFAHAQDADFADGESATISPKIALIKEIHAAGKEVEAFIIRLNLPSEEVAYDVEASVLDTLNLLDPVDDNDRNPFFKLKNLAGGHHSATRGLMTVGNAHAIFEAPPAPAITVPALLIKIPGLWTPSMNAAELYDATRQWWKLSARRNNAEYAFAVNHGVIRAVYTIDHSTWVRDEESGRWSFQGSVAAELESQYLNMSVKHLYQRGQANPIYYQNC